MISLSNLSKAFGDRPLFTGVSMRLDPGQRYGLVGANGSGKTTLMHILAGDEPASDGEVIMPSGTRVGVLKQDRYLSDRQRIIDVAMMGDKRAWEALSAKDELLEQAEPDAHAIAELEERIALFDGYTLESRAAAILEGLGIPENLHAEPLSTLSGGFKLRVLLAQTLVESPEVLLLDEPTNHLDILTIRWLEEHLRRFDGCVIVISHDHRFLDAVATHILDVDYETVTLYHGNYSRFIEQKRETRERMEAALERQQKIIADKKAFVERFRAKATKARQAQSRVKQIEKIESKIEDLPQTSRQAPIFAFAAGKRSGRDVLEVSALEKSYGDKRVLRGVSLAVRRGERVAVIGANGLGKSTLLKILVGAQTADAGEVRWGHEIDVGYFAQDHRDLIGERSGTVLDYLWDFCPTETTSFVRGKLGQMLFSGDDVKKKTASLSGGEAARLIFSRLMVQKPNVLVLDEPTNHLDLESIEALTEALRAYDGTLIFVSHDRWFVSELATRVIELHREGIVDYPGTYDEFIAREGEDHLDAEAVLQRAKAERRKPEPAAKPSQETRVKKSVSTSAKSTSEPPPAAPPAAKAPAAKAPPAERPLDWREQKRRRAEHRKLTSRRDEVTAAIERAEGRLAEIKERYCEPGFFTDTAADEVSALQTEEADLGPQIEKLMREWEFLEASLERLGEP